MLIINSIVFDHEGLAMIKINLKELHRTKWIYGFLAAELFFYSYILFTEPFSTVATTIFLQISFLLNMLYGANFAFRLTNEDYKNAMDSLGPNLHRYVSASFTTILLVNLINYLLLSGISLMMLFLGRFPSWLFREILQLNLMYFLVNNLSCAAAGYIIGFLVVHRIKYLFLLILSFIVSPVSKIVLPYVSFFSVFNLGPYSVNVVQNQMYGFDTEITRLYKFLTILTALLLFGLILLYRRIKVHKLAPVTALLLAALIFSAWQWSVPAWVRRPLGSNGDPLAEDNYDFKYYSTYLAPDAAQHPVNYRISDMKIDLWLKREAIFEVQLTVEGLFDQDYINGSLYHGFKIEQVQADGQMISFKQVGDLFTISLPLKQNQTRQLTLTYKGLSSPYFPANYKACTFPAYYNWLPLARVQPSAFIYDSYYANFNAAYNTDPIDYEVTLHADPRKTAFSSLDRGPDGVFRGRSDAGVSLYYGNLHLGSEDMAAVASIPKKEAEHLAQRADALREEYQAVAKKYGLAQTDLHFKFIHGLWLNTAYNHQIGFEDYGVIKVSGLDEPLREENMLFNLIYGSYEWRRQPVKVQDMIFYMVDGLPAQDKERMAYAIEEHDLGAYFEMPVEQREKTLHEIFSQLKEGRVSEDTLRRIMEGTTHAEN